MYIRKKAVAAGYKLSIGVLALVAWWSLLLQEGWLAFRLFPTWVLGIAAVYFITASVLLALRQDNERKRNYCPMLEGMILLGFLLIGGVALASAIDNFALPELPTWILVLTCVIMPVLVLLDWTLFAKKGDWRVIDPFYWLALPVCYAATMIFTAELLGDDLTLLRYPLPVFDYMEFGLFDMLGWLLVVAILDLTVGYIFFLADFAMSGKLAKKIVLPHIRTVVIDEDDTEKVGAPQSAVGSTPENLVANSKAQTSRRPQPARKPALGKPKIKAAQSKISVPEVEITKVTEKAKPKVATKKSATIASTRAAKVDSKIETELSQARDAREMMEKPISRLKTSKTMSASGSTTGPKPAQKSELKSEPKMASESEPKPEPKHKNKPISEPKNIKINKSSVN